MINLQCRTPYSLIWFFPFTEKNVKMIAEIYDISFFFYLLMLLAIGSFDSIGNTKHILPVFALFFNSSWPGSIMFLFHSLEWEYKRQLFIILGFINFVCYCFLYIGKNAYAISVLRRVEMKLDGRDIEDSRYM